MTAIEDRRIQASPSSGGEVLYDGECAMCTSLARRYETDLAGTGLRLRTLQDAARDPELSARLGLVEGRFNEMWVVPTEGEAAGGADRVLLLARNRPWAKPLLLLARYPLGMALLRRGYAWVARNRLVMSKLLTGAAAGVRWVVPPMASLGAALFAGTMLPAWAWMWTLGAALFFGCKWISLIAALAKQPAIPVSRRLAFLLGWVGMDAEAFLLGDSAARPTAPEYIRPGWKVLAGVALLAVGVPAISARAPHLAAWVGLIGLILVLHFGAFHLLALGWQALGVNARPIMNRPLRSRSVSEFWGRRWNDGFHKIAHAFIYKPIRKRSNALTGGLAAFLFSGLIHELVISVPAGGGYGLPTAYFLLQFAGMHTERSAIGTHLGLRTGIAGWLFTVAVTAGPAYGLFHPWFLERVAIPMFTVLGLWH